MTSAQRGTIDVHVGSYGARARTAFIAIGMSPPARSNAGLADTDPGSALRYREDVCHNVDSGRSYAQLVSDVEADKSALEDGQGGYLIGRAVDELSPRLIHALRMSVSQGWK